MVRVPAGNLRVNYGGIGELTGAIGSFDIDRFEVTNRQFKEFVDKGGYRNRVFWTEPMIDNGRTLSWEAAMARFVDPTGRPGPSTWQAGSYAEGHAEDPVTGVSWYEAAAYAARRDRHDSQKGRRCDVVSAGGDRRGVAGAVDRTHARFGAPMAQRLQAALSANHDMRLVDVMSLDQAAAGGGQARRFLLRISAVVAVVALLLSTADIYSLISFTLARRTREIGIRIALGAGPRRIITGVLSRAFAQIGTGVLTGAVPSTAIVVLGAEDSGGVGMAAGVSATLAVCAFVILVAIISCAAPLRRALRIEPTQALRADG